MPREILRLVVLFFVIYFLISDIIELLSYLPTTSITVAPLLQRMLAAKLRQNNKLKVKQEPSRQNEAELDGSVVERLQLTQGPTKSKMSTATASSTLAPSGNQDKELTRKELR